VCGCVSEHMHWRHRHFGRIYGTWSSTTTSKHSIQSSLLLLISWHLKTSNDVVFASKMHGYGVAAGRKKTDWSLRLVPSFPFNAKSLCTQTSPLFSTKFQKLMQKQFGLLKSHDEIQVGIVQTLNLAPINQCRRSHTLKFGKVIQPCNSGCRYPF
jgi:hypothetical protein